MIKNNDNASGKGCKIIIMADIILEFLIYSVVGWAMECLWYRLVTGKMRDKRMLLHLPMCPVYGLGAVMIVHMTDAMTDSRVLIFAFGALIASAVELAYFLINEAAFGLRVWDYSKHKVNYRGGVCLFYTLLWGGLSLILVGWIHPVTENILAAASPSLKLISVVFLGILTAGDMEKTFRFLLRFRRGQEQNLPDCFWYMHKI